METMQCIYKEISPEAFFFMSFLLADLRFKSQRCETQLAFVYLESAAVKSRTQMLILI